MNYELEPIQQQLVNAIKKNGAMSRNDFCKEFGYKMHIYDQTVLIPSKKKYYFKLKQYEKRTTIYDNLVKLEKKGIVEKFSKNNGKVGASVKMWKLTTESDKKTDLEKDIDNIMRQVCAHVMWLFKDDEIYNDIKTLITTNPKKRAELVALLSED